MSLYSIQKFNPADFFVLVVDDLAKNLQLACSVLRKSGYRVSPANSGKQALERIANVRPDIILLDLMMPEMSGLDVCKELKKDPSTYDIPVIFLTASHEMEDLLNAFDLGAVDYVGKPFYASELLARVRIHLELKHSREQLQKANDSLVDLNAEKNEFMGIASHDLKNPLTSIIGISQLIKSNEEMPVEKMRSWVDKIEAQSEKMVYIIKNLLDVNRLDQGELRYNRTHLDLSPIVNEIYLHQLGMAEPKDQEMIITTAGEPLIVNCDQNILMQVFENLISNAVKYTPHEKRIWVETKKDGDYAVFTVKDEGPGLSVSDQDKLFQRFSKLSPQPTGGEHSSGLGLSIVKRFVEDMGGEVWCESIEGKGCLFGTRFKLCQ
ncbi:hybrid sensor histidine kinase/response regulator [Puniceicoccaceae bacterium K14]|nr:hybrid sensor histidine kinase/response regulator [Puniceicoccaceae bacterium K14]